jgi:hypothetical protein
LFSGRERMSNEKACYSILARINKVVETDKKVLVFSIYNPDKINRIRVCLKDKKTTGERELTLVFFGWKECYKFLYSLETFSLNKVIDFKKVFE